MILPNMLMKQMHHLLLDHGLAGNEVSHFSKVVHHNQNILIDIVISDFARRELNNEVHEDVSPLSFRHSEQFQQIMILILRGLVSQTCMAVADKSPNHLYHPGPPIVVGNKVICLVPTQMISHWRIMGFMDDTQTNVSNLRQVQMILISNLVISL